MMPMCFQEDVLPVFKRYKIANQLLFDTASRFFFSWTMTSYVEIIII